MSTGKKLAPRNSAYQWAMKTEKANFKFENDSTASIDLVHACKQLSLMTAEVSLIKNNPKLTKNST